MMETEPSAVREWASLLGRLALGGLLAVICVLAPVVAAVLFHPLAGVPTALVSFWVWSRFGAPPMPGFLNGLLALQGYAAIFGSLLACIALMLR
ncbi:MAG: hypothetical protein WHU94_13085 [Thermogemmata sp.]